MISELVKKSLLKQSYRIVGNHSACKLCSWTKKSLLDKGVCYKEIFYNIKSHMCCQMTPCLICPNSCVYCWREMSGLVGDKLNEFDEPDDIIAGCIEAQRNLINGFPGDERLNLKKFKEAQDPKFWAISLAGEPTIYDKLGGLIGELKSRKNCTFLVTNGLFPRSIEKLDNLPTQLYVSLDAPSREVYKRIDRPMLKDYWERLNKTLELLPSLDTRTVLRITAVKGFNMLDEKGYIELIRKANPMFIEVKAYMFVGSSRQRLSIENMPRHFEVKEFAERICEKSGLSIIDEKEESRVVLLAEKDSKKRKLSFD